MSTQSTTTDTTLDAIVAEIERKIMALGPAIDRREAEGVAWVFALRGERTGLRIALDVIAKTRENA